MAPCVTIFYAAAAVEQVGRAWLSILYCLKFKISYECSRIRKDYISFTLGGTNVGILWVVL